MNWLLIDNRRYRACYAGAIATSALIRKGRLLMAEPQSQAPRPQIGGQKCLP